LSKQMSLKQESIYARQEGHLTQHSFKHKRGLSCIKACYFDTPNGAAASAQVNVTLQHTHTHTHTHTPSIVNNLEVIKAVAQQLHSRLPAEGSI